MSNEEQTVIPPIEQQTIPPTDDLMDMPALKKASELLQKLEEKEKALQEREIQIDKKIKDMDRTAAEIRISGYSHVSQQITEEERKDNDARKLIAGSGLESYAFPDKKKKMKDAGFIDIICIKCGFKRKVMINSPRHRDNICGECWRDWE